VKEEGVVKVLLHPAAVRHERRVDLVFRELPTGQSISGPRSKCGFSDARRLGLLGAKWGRRMVLEMGWVEGKEGEYTEATKVQDVRSGGGRRTIKRRIPPPFSHFPLV
jgi:hypothetical protein